MPTYARERKQREARGNNYWEEPEKKEQKTLKEFEEEDNDQNIERRLK